MLKIQKTPRHLRDGVFGYGELMGICYQCPASANAPSDGVTIPLQTPGDLFPVAFNEQSNSGITCLFLIKVSV